MTAHGYVDEYGQPAVAPVRDMLGWYQARCACGERYARRTESAASRKLDQHLMATRIQRSPAAVREHIEQYARGPRERVIALALFDSTPFAEERDPRGWLCMANNVVKALDEHVTADPGEDVR